MKTRILFSRFGKKFFFATFAISIALWAVAITRGGLNFGIDFTSGEKYEILLTQQVDTDEFAAILQTSFDKAVVQNLESSVENSFAYSIKVASDFETLTQERVDLFLTAVEDAYGEVELLGSSFISGTISSNLVRSSIILVLSAIALILVYIWFRFKIQYAVASIVALAHDAFFVVGIIGALQIEVSAATIAAVLTIIGYSLNDTIVIFDRVRENFALQKGETLSRITDASLNATLSRTLVTSITTLLAATALFVFSVGDVKTFALTLMIGVIEGTWSSIFIAVPMLQFLGKSLAAQETSAKTSKSPQGISASSGVASPASSAKATAKSSASGVTPLSNNEIEKLRAEILAHKRHKKS